MWISLGRISLIVLLALSEIGPSAAQDRSYTVKPGDLLSISVWKEPDLSGQVLVRPDGKFSFQLVGEVDARGKTVGEIQQTVNERLKAYISDPVVTVTIDQINGNTIYVIGQVQRPGNFAVNRTVDVMQALSMAGGATPFAALNDILILRRTDTGQVALPFRYSDVAKGKDLEQNIELRAGDVVVVP